MDEATKVLEDDVHEVGTEKVDKAIPTLVQEATEAKELENPLALTIYTMEVCKALRFGEAHLSEEENDDFLVESIYNSLGSDHDEKMDPKRKMRIDFLDNENEDDESPPS